MLLKTQVLSPLKLECYRKQRGLMLVTSRGKWRLQTICPGQRLGLRQRSLRSCCPEHRVPAPPQRCVHAETIPVRCGSSSYVMVTMSLFQTLPLRPVKAPVAGRPGRRSRGRKLLEPRHSTPWLRPVRLIRRSALQMGLRTLLPKSHVPQRGNHHFTQGVQSAQVGIGFDGTVGSR
jgi:hypothetical protein